MSIRTPYFHVAMESVDITPWVRSVTVVEGDREADNVSIAIADPLMVYADALFEGSQAEIDLGYTGPQEHALLLRATITKVEVDYPDGGVPSITLKGQDRSIDMALVERNKVWRDRKVSAVVKAVAQPYAFAGGVQVDVQPDRQIRGRPVHQDGKTDLAFLQELATDHHSKCFVELDEQDREILYFIPERRIVTTRRPQQIVLRYRSGPGSNLIRFSPTFDASYIDRVREINDLGHDGRAVRTPDTPPAEVVLWQLDEARLAQAGAADRERINALFQKGSARKRDLQRQLAERRPAVGAVAPDQDEAATSATTLESRRLGMSATGTTFGNIWLRAKSNVTIAGVNERFSGDWYVSSVTHKIDDSGFKTEFKAVR